ncbi:hypothetical protein FNV43_RR17444 [Rhamnella rubrinervis]|uniref:non-specific serine/threonine protein kinase n=1 Tax=Rhamnella rubrinervis TaxID=2594499 RepID=A0A8K0E3P9_9ROSA|nr:hypothetical protein FNV43_RR17444 [Rhamnella rubrinervis]
MALSKPLPYLFNISFFLLLVTNAESVFFNFTSFQPNMPDIDFQGDASPSSGVLQLTKSRLGEQLSFSVGRASYVEAVRLWDAGTGSLTDFTTHFTFVIKPNEQNQNPNWLGDGMAFFITPFDTDGIPNNSSGGNLALFSGEFAFNTSSNHIVAVEFDTFMNEWDPRSAIHMGININSIISVTNVTLNSSIKNGSKTNALVSYNSTTQNLSVFLTYTHNSRFAGKASLSYVVDLRKYLPENVRVGFSASTGEVTELHNLLSWSFNSSLVMMAEKRKGKAGLGIGLGVGFGVLACALALLWIIWRRTGGKEENEAYDASMDDEFQKGTGPKRFTYRELRRATNNFAEKGKLGEGGFGGVYRGLLAEDNTEVAVKRVSRGSKQGKKEYISEVKIISRLRHRNLVQLIGWCHEQGEFLLVYEFMPNGSLDSHLFHGKTILTWTLRYKVAVGLASALLYLHDEWEQCVVHRDIKSSNIMLDSNFNAKLGDFGLARLVDHELGSQTTVLAGTMGYLAPECVTSGRASKESDVYSFGVVALEISCGRRPVEQKEEPGQVRLVEWVWELYGKGQILEAVDEGLRMEFDERQVGRLMVVGLWCCHPDPEIRPSIKQVINVLNFEAPLPSLPAKLPVPMYLAPPLQMCRFSYTSSDPTQAGSLIDRTHCSCSSCNTYSTTSGASSEVLLKSHEAGT